MTCKPGESKELKVTKYRAGTPRSRVRKQKTDVVKKLGRLRGLLRSHDLKCWQIGDLTVDVLVGHQIHEGEDTYSIEPINQLQELRPRGQHLHFEASHTISVTAVNRFCDTPSG